MEELKKLIIENEYVMLIFPIAIILLFFIAMFFILFACKIILKIIK